VVVGVERSVEALDPRQAAEEQIDGGLQRRPPARLRDANEPAAQLLSQVIRQRLVVAGE
jgi:hypothetical protein